MHAHIHAQRCSEDMMPTGKRSRISLRASNSTRLSIDIAAKPALQPLSAANGWLHPTTYCSLLKLAAFPPPSPLHTESCFIPRQMRRMLPKLLINFWNGKFCAKYNFSISVEIFVWFSALLWFFAIPCRKSGSGYIVGLYIYKAKVEDITLWKEPRQLNLKIEP